jgi:hypothetical protein
MMQLPQQNLVRTGADPKTRNLILVTELHRQDWQDFDEIAHLVVRVAPEVAVYIVSVFETADEVTSLKWDKPSVTVCFGAIGRFVPRRGPVFENRPVVKLEQYRRFLDAGMATPRTQRFEFGRSYSPDEWSEFVIVKPLPLSMSSRGGNCRFYRTRRLEQLAPENLSPDHILRQAPALVQSFVDTGPFPWKWRVLTLFGEPLYSSISKSPVERVSLAASDEGIEKAIVEAKHPTFKVIDPGGTRRGLAADERVLAFARRMHEVFPRTPILGCDILQREADGELFALEANAGGNVWHFSSTKEGHRERLGGRQKMIDQLGAWQIAAQALARIARDNAA